MLITLTADLADVSPSPLSTVPFPRDSDYVRRGPLIQEINTKLSVPGARVALVGLGGVGQCILEFHRSRAPAKRDIASRSSPSIMLVKSETTRHRRGCYGSTPPVQHALSRALARPLTTWRCAEEEIQQPTHSSFCAIGYWTSEMESGCSSLTMSTMRTTYCNLRPGLA